MEQREQLFWVWLAEALGAGSRVFRRLITFYDSPYEIFHAEESEIERIPDLSARVQKALSDKSLQRATEIVESCERNGIGILTWGDADYPRILREIQSPPCVLYYLGELPDWNDRLCIGMVGTRRMSAYGLRTAYKISYELARAGAITVSGMAAGIDGVCAAAAMAAGGRTVAFLGCGVDIVYPSHHRSLYREIARQGTVVSEYPPATRPASYHFPLRNRLISGISQGTVVVEAGFGSGSLITAKEADLQGRDLFAVPANVGSRGAEGTNGLIRDGATPVLSTEDVLEPYRYLFSDTLDLEAAKNAGESASADLKYLERLGVVELTKPREVQPPLQASAETEPHGKEERKTAKRKAVKKETDATDARTDAGRREASCKTPTPDAVLSSLTPIQLAVLQAIPDDRAITADSLGNLGYPYGETVAALTMLEILGLIQKLPGALYTKS